MSLNDLKAAFSHAYVHAVAHAAGYFAQDSNRDMDADGVDVTLFSRDVSGVVRSPRLELQLKCTEQPIAADPFPFDLPVKNYEELSDPRNPLPRLLVVVVVREEVANWTSASDDQLVLRHCGYWHSLNGAAPTTWSWRPVTTRMHSTRTRTRSWSQFRARSFAMAPVGLFGRCATSLSSMTLTSADRSLGAYP